MKETAKQHYEQQLETLHSLLWEMECYHVNGMNKAYVQPIDWGDCGDMGYIIEKLREVVNFAYGRE